MTVTLEPGGAPVEFDAPGLGATIELEVPDLGIVLDSPSLPTSIETPATGDALVVPVSGPAGAAGAGAILVERITGQILSGHRLVVPADDGTVVYATNLDMANLHKPIWLTTSSWNAGDLATLTPEGPVTEPSWSWALGSLYLGIDGFITTVLPTAGFVRQVGYAITATEIYFDPQAPIQLA